MIIKRCMLLLSFVFFVATAKTGFITLEGFVPHTIDEATIMFEYKRIYNTLAPGAFIDRSPLTITFFTSAFTKNEVYSLPEWGGGGAIGGNHIVVCIDRKPFLQHTIYQVTVHELVHITLHRIGRYIELPRWFHEGLAMNLSCEATSQEGYTLSKALFTGSLLPLSTIDSVNMFKQFRAELAYSQSRMAVSWLIEMYGMEIIPEILDAAVKRGSFWNGFYDVLQVNEREMELMYHKYIMERHSIFLWLFDSYVPWTIMLFLFLLGYVLTRFRRAKRKEELEAEEKMEDSLLTEQNGPPKDSTPPAGS